MQAIQNKSLKNISLAYIPSSKYVEQTTYFKDTNTEDLTPLEDITEAELDLFYSNIQSGLSDFNSFSSGQLTAERAEPPQNNFTINMTQVTKPSGLEYFHHSSPTSVTSSSVSPASQESSPENKNMNPISLPQVQISHSPSHKRKISKIDKEDSKKVKQESTAPRKKKRTANDLLKENYMKCY